MEANRFLSPFDNNGKGVSLMISPYKCAYPGFWSGAPPYYVLPSRSSVLDTCDLQFYIESVCCIVDSQYLFHHLRVEAEHYQLMRSLSDIQMLFWEDICHLFLVRFLPPLESILCSFVSLCSLVVH